VDQYIIPILHKVQIHLPNLFFVNRSTVLKLTKFMPHCHTNVIMICEWSVCAGTDRSFH